MDEQIEIAIEVDRILTAWEPVLDILDDVEDDGSADDDEDVIAEWIDEQQED